jgi:subtilase family serine protease
MLLAVANRNEALRRPVFCLSTVCAVVLLLCATMLAQAQSADLVRSPVDPGSRVLLKGHHPLWANSKNDGGAVPADLPIEHVTIVLNRAPQLQQAFEQFLRDQQNPASSDYHHWLTPAQIGQRFGVSSHDIAAVTGWLKSQGLQVDSVSNSRQRITFSGPASAVATAFATEMHYFTVNGEKRISINSEPQIPSALADVIDSISGLFTVKLYPQHKSETVHQRSHNEASSFGAQPEGSGFSCNGVPCNVVFPADFAVIYNLNGVTGGINGAQQTIAIIGRSGVCPFDIINFASSAAITANIPGNITVGPAPPPPVCSGTASKDQSEATLDVTRSGSIAQGASLDLVISASTATMDGIQIATEAAVDNPLPGAPHIMSISFGNCEQQEGQSGVHFWDSLFSQAAGQGMSVFVSSGDSGAAGCDTAGAPPPPNQILSPNYICASSYATCVGGTEFADSANPGQYWSPTNGTGFESALSYIPEGAWNEPLTNQSQVQVLGTGGGVSQFIATPSWQVGTGVPPARAGRYTPDVAFTAAFHDAYFGCLAGNNQCSPNTSFTVFAGTSAAAPDMAGITALLNQKQGSAQGLLNPNLYALAATPANGVFNDVTVATSGVTNCVVTTPSMCNNSTAGTTGLTGGLSGYLVTPGFDEATGLGSINVANLITNWSLAVALTATTLSASPPSPVNAGTSVTLSATVKPVSGTATPTGTVTFFNGSTALNSTPAPVTNGVATFTSSTLAGASYSITAAFSPATGTSFAASTSSALPYKVQDFTVTANPTTVTVTAPGQSGTTTLTIAPLGGFNQTISYSCTGLPSEATCTFAAASATSETVTIATTPASARLDKAPFGGSREIFYALLLPGFLGLVLLTGNRKRTWRGVHLLSLIAVLALSVLWMPACGGGGSSTTPPSNPGTPAGTSSVTITATAGTLTPKTVPITLTVQ